MKGMGTWLSLLGVSMFCGIVLFSVAAGSIWPNLNAIAAPIVCGSRTLEITQDAASYLPGRVDTTTTDYCVDQATGTKQEVTGAIVLVAGMIDSLILFAILAGWALWSRYGARRSKGREAQGQYNS